MLTMVLLRSCTFVLVEVLTCNVVSTLPPRASCLREDSKPLDSEFLWNPYASFRSTIVVSVSKVGEGEALLLASSCPRAYPIAALLLTMSSVSRLVRSASLFALSFSRSARSALRIASCIFLSSSASLFSMMLVSSRILGDGDRRGIDLLGELLGGDRCLAMYSSTRETQVLVRPAAWFW